MLCNSFGYSCCIFGVYGAGLAFSVMHWYPWVVAMVGLNVIMCSLVVVLDTGGLVGFMFVCVVGVGGFGDWASVGSIMFVVFECSAGAFVVRGAVSFLGVIRKTCIGDSVLPPNFQEFPG